MLILFEIIKVVFFVLTIIVGVVLTGGWGLDLAVVETLKQVLLPGYLLTTGLMIGYIVAHILALRHEGYHHRSWVWGISIGILIGFIFALLYVLA